MFPVVSCLPVDEPSDSTAFNQVKMRSRKFINVGLDFKDDFALICGVFCLSVFPQKEFSLKNSAAFIQSMDSLLKEHSDEGEPSVLRFLFIYFV